MLPIVFPIVILASFFPFQGLATPVSISSLEARSGKSVSFTNGHLKLSLDLAFEDDEDASSAPKIASVQVDKEEGKVEKKDEDPQSSLSLLPSLLNTASFTDGHPLAGSGNTPSIFSSNNFINYCATRPDLELTNGTMKKQGSCNPIPMGMLMSFDKMPHAKFVYPSNLAVIKPNVTFNVSMAIRNLNTGHFTNPEGSYYSAPAQLDSDGYLLGHSHIVIQAISSLTSTDPLDPTRFTFFSGVNGLTVDGKLSAAVTGGLPEGTYRLGSMNAAANHQSINGPVAQRGLFDDTVYFTVSADAPEQPVRRSSPSTDSKSAYRMKRSIARR